MEKRIEIKGPRAEGLSQEYFRTLFDKYRLEGAKVKYEPRENLPNHPSSRGRGVITVTGDFNVSDVYSILSKEFIITKINGIDLENILGEKQ
ncbi:MAG: hypothetical protein Q8P79_00535 [Nanoarchaeota archaeon]|nr:hypothetical protein [Nanoarchaeota archaeon]